jgi:hypothetical protein
MLLENGPVAFGLAKRVAVTVGVCALPFWTARNGQTTRAAMRKNLRTFAEVRLDRDFIVVVSL